MIISKVDEHSDTTLVICEGMITSEDITGTIDNFYSKKPTRNVIWDLSEADLSSIRSQDVERIAFYTRERAHSRMDRRTAIIASEDIQFGFSRMYEVYADAAQQKTKIKVFRTMEEAKEWLKE